MPRFRMRLAGIATVILAGASCTSFQAPKVEGPPPPPSGTPSAVPSPPGDWSEDLSFSGDLTGTLSLVANPGSATQSECTGRNSRRAGAWASSLFGFIGPDVYGVITTVSNYRGPGTYSVPDVSVQVHNPDSSAVWQSPADGPATFTVENGEESGTVDATLVNLASNQTKLQVHGHWSCRT